MESVEILSAGSLTAYVPPPRIGAVAPNPQLTPIMEIEYTNAQIKFGFNDINHTFAIYFRGQSTDKTCVFFVRSALE